VRSDIPASIVSALSHPDGAEVRARLEGARSRHFSTTFDTTHQAPFAQLPGIVQDPRPQACVLTHGLMVSAMVHDGEVWLMQTFGDPFRPTLSGVTIAANERGRPGIAEHNDNVLRLFVQHDSNVKLVEIDTNLALAGTAECVLSEETIITGMPLAAIHAVSSLELAVLWLVEGGIAVSRVAWDGAWIDDQWVGRFMVPDQVLLSTETNDLDWMNYSAAVRIEGRMFVYQSVPSGDVTACFYSDTGAWSDSFTAVPADLSVFAVSSAFLFDDQVFLCGQFARADSTGLYSSDYVFGLLLPSRNGIDFALDRTVAFCGGDSSESTSIALCWHAAAGAELDARYGIDGAGVVYSDANRWFVLPAHFGIDGVMGEYALEDLIQVRGSFGSGLSLQAGMETLIKTSQVLEGDVVDVSFGVTVAGGYVEWYQVMRCMVTGISESFSDGSRKFELTALPWTAAKLDDMTHPFALTIMGKEMLHDPCDTMDNFDAASEEGYVLFPFSVDFWDGGDQIAEKAQNAGAEREFNSGDLMSTIGLVSYPVIQALPFNIELYGWSRSGLQTDLEGGGGDVPSDPAAPNDLMKARFTIQREGVNEEISITVDDVSPDGTYDHFPQTWYTSDPGDYPVILQGDEDDGFLVGDRIMSVGTIFSNTRTPNTAETTFLPERVAIPSVTMKVTSFMEDFEPITETEGFPDSWDFSKGYEGWVWEVADEAGDPTVSYGWNYAAGCVAVGGIQIDTSRPGGGYPPVADSCGHVGPNTFASGAGKFSWYPPADIYATANSTVTFNVSLLFRTVYIVSAGNAGITVLFKDGSSYGAHLVGAVDNETKSGVVATLTLPESFAGKVVEKICINGGSRGYLTRFHSASIAGFIIPEILDDSGQELMRFGIPVIFFAQKPFYAINCVVEAKYKLVGEDAWGGVVCLASDGENYVAARSSPLKVQIIKVRAGLVTVLAETTHTFPSLYGWVSLRYVDGNFEVRIKNVLSGLWSAPLLEYAWREADGTLLANIEISHVGIYALRDAPYVRICGLDLAQGCGAFGVLPDSPMFDELPASGTLRIEDVSYTYTGKSVVAQQMGPYQGRNTGGPYSYSNSGASYGGYAAEFLRFEWADPSERSDFDGAYMSTDSGVAWRLEDVDYKPFITTEGVTIYLKNRGRFFSPSATADVIGMSVQVWIVNAITGLALVEGEGGSHAKGTVAYLTSTSAVKLMEFAAALAVEPLTDKDAIGKLCALARGQAAFPGDVLASSVSLSSSPWEVQRG